MQNKDFKVLIVEDDPLVQLDLVDRLDALGFNNIVTRDNGENVITYMSEINPQIILMDIELTGSIDGIETAKTIKADKEIPIIFLTDHIDDMTFQRALATTPVAFLHKPFNDLEVSQNIEIAMLHYDNNSDDDYHNVLVADGLFASNKEGYFEKVSFESIRYLEAGRSYCDIYIDNRQLPLTVAKSMKVVLQILHNSKFKERFVRVQKSFAVNTTFITGFTGKVLLLDKVEVKTSTKYISDLKTLFHTL